MKQLTSVLLSFVLAIGLFSQAQAQEKIGFANMELILSYMSESKAMSQKLKTYENQLSKLLKQKEDQLKAEYQVYLTRKEAGAPETELKTLEDKITKMDEGVRAFAEEAQGKLQRKRQDYLEPIVEKLDSHIKSVAEAGGYTYILNTTDGTGLSIILQGAEENEVSKKILESMGVTLPKE